MARGSRAVMGLAVAAVAAMITPGRALIQGGDAHPELVGHYIPSRFYEVPLCGERPALDDQVPEWEQNCSVHDKYSQIDTMRDSILAKMLLDFRHNASAAGVWSCNSHGPRFREHHGLICTSEDNCTGTDDGSGAFLFACSPQLQWTGEACGVELVQPCNVESSLQFFDQLLMRKENPVNPLEFSNANIATIVSWLSLGSAYYHGTGCSGLPQQMDVNSMKILFAYFVSQLAPYAVTPGDAQFPYSSISAYIAMAEEALTAPNFATEDGVAAFEEIWGASLEQLPPYDFSAMLLIKVAHNVCPLLYRLGINSAIATFGFDADYVAAYAAFNESAAVHPDGKLLAENMGQCSALLAILADFQTGLGDQEELRPLELSPTFQAHPDHPRNQSLGEADCPKFPHYQWHKAVADVVSNINMLIKSVRISNGYPTHAPTTSPTALPTRAPTIEPTEAPTSAPTDAPTATPTQTPTIIGTTVPPETVAPETSTVATTQAPAPSALSCMSGNTEVIRSAAGTPKVRVVDLVVGDLINGIGEDLTPRECRVLSVGQFGAGQLYGNYTAHHFLVNTSRDGVDYAGNASVGSVQDKYSVLTDCPAATDASGIQFTPMDGDFCGTSVSTMSWSSYLELYRAYVALVRETGGFWTAKDSFKNLDALAQLTPTLCTEFFTCVVDGRDCDEFERVAQIVVENHLADEHKATTLAAFPQIGMVNAPKSVSFRARETLGPTSNGDSNGLSDKATAAIVVVLLICVAVVAAVGVMFVKSRRTGRREPSKTAPTSGSQVPLKLGAGHAEVGSTGNIYEVAV
eukprot:m.462111 g.462111  ORF g.462111 m.462111 type:complete len:803 (-) comp22526_c0_seq1:99-2507(-)